MYVNVFFSATPLRVRLLHIHNWIFPGSPRPSSGLLLYSIAQWLYGTQTSLSYFC